MSSIEGTSLNNVKTFHSDYGTDTIKVNAEIIPELFKTITENQDHRAKCFTGTYDKFNVAVIYKEIGGAIDSKLHDKIKELKAKRYNSKNPRLIQGLDEILTIYEEHYLPRENMQGRIDQYKRNKGLFISKGRNKLLTTIEMSAGYVGQARVLLHNPETNNLSMYRLVVRPDKTVTKIDVYKHNLEFDLSQALIDMAFTYKTRKDNDPDWENPPFGNGDECLVFNLGLYRCYELKDFKKPEDEEIANTAIKAFESLVK